MNGTIGSGHATTAPKWFEPHVVFLGIDFYRDEFLEEENRKSREEGLYEWWLNIQLIQRPSGVGLRLEMVRCCEHSHSPQQEIPIMFEFFRRYFDGDGVVSIFEGVEASRPLRRASSDLLLELDRGCDDKVLVLQPEERREETQEKEPLDLAG